MDSPRPDPDGDSEQRPDADGGPDEVPAPGAGRAVTLATLVEVMTTIESALAIAREEVDGLNVFPVPDGDTGTNLVMTVRAALAEVDLDADPATRARQLGHGAVRGARGNSGVIFSQVIRALLEHVTEDPFTTDDLAGFLSGARDLSYAAVGDPVQGTILTAMDEAVDAAERARADHLDLPGALEQVADAVALAVARTRDVLEANRLAGVVDAGARGFEVAIIALRAHLQGDEVPSQPPPVRRSQGTGEISRESGSLEYQFEVQYLLEAPDERADVLRRELTGLGDSVVVVACGGLLNVHVHTNRVDDAVAVGERLGTAERVEVHAFADQIDRPTVEARVARRPIGHVAVLPSTALRDLVAGPGIEVVVGGPGSLPSVADLLASAARTNAEHVVLLPGNRNAVPTARTAATVSRAEEGPDLHVVEEASTPPSVLAALAVADEVDLDLDLLATAAADVLAGEVVAAVRTATTPVGEVTIGDLLVVIGGAVVAASPDADRMRDRLLDHLLADGAELVTVLAGDQTTDRDRAAMAAAITARVPDAEVEVIAAGLPTSRWLVGAEGVPVHR